MLPELEIIKAEQARRNFKKFIVHAWPQIEPGEKFVDGWHIDALVDHLVAVYDGQIRYLLINIPPRHAKSIVLAVLWQVWIWLQKPHLKFVYASHSMLFSLRDSFKALSLIKSDWFQLRYGHIFSLNKKKQSPKTFLNNFNGYRFSTAVDAGATGEGGNFIVCFTYDAKIKLIFGELPIGMIVENKLLASCLSFNKLKNKVEYKRIIKHFESTVDEVIEIIYGDDKILFCTKNHPIFVMGQGYINAENLKKNDILFGKDSNQVFIKSISVIKKTTKVYNIEVEENNNYFAGDILVHNCDDAHNTTDAESALELEKTKRWWFETMGSRGNDPKTVARIVQGQKQSDLDLYAEILRRGQCEHLCLPEEFDGVRRKTVLGFYDKRINKNELLWPARLGAEEVAQLKVELGPFAWAAQYQQNPTPRGGAIIKLDWIKYYNLVKDPNGYILAPKFSSIYQSWDTAFKEGQENDYSVCQTWGIAQDGFYLINQFRSKIEFPTLKKTAIMLCNTYMPKSVLIEDKGSGQSLLQALKTETQLPFLGINPGRMDKNERLKSVSGLWEAGKVFLPLGASWLDEYIGEITKFPTAEHDDQVDTTTQFLITKALPALKHQHEKDRQFFHMAR